MSEDSVPGRASRHTRTSSRRHGGAGPGSTRTGRRSATRHPPSASRGETARSGPFADWLKFAAFALAVILGTIALGNMQPTLAPPPPVQNDPNATLVPTAEPLFSLPPLPLLSTRPPTAVPTPTVPPMPDVALIAGHWAKQNPDGVPTVLDSGAVCADGLREVDITKSVADKLLLLLEGRGYRVELLEEFDARLKKINPDFAPRALLSIHADSCLTGPDYVFATGYKIAHAEPSANPAEDGRLVACLIRAYGRAVAPFGLSFNANTITRNMTEYHAFREIDPKTPAAIIELGFLGYDRKVLVNHQDDLARGLAIGLADFLKGEACAPPSATPQATDEIKE